MHNISKHRLQELASELIVLCNKQNTEQILLKSRELYEMSVLFHHQNQSEEKQITTPIEVTQKPATPIVETPVFTPKVEETIEVSTPLVQEIEKNIEKPIIEETTLSVEEKIKQIMDNAPQFTPKQEVFPVEINETAVDDILKAPNPIEEIKKVIPTRSFEEELKVGITGVDASNMFEKPTENTEIKESIFKLETPKKSLNDILSQNQIQIGLNDRIAFVKHLFNDNIADFNRVISQLNTFSSELEAKNFIENSVKPDYNWSNKEEYEVRLIQLIERRFL